jgi:hypothetical protein
VTPQQSHSKREMPIAEVVRLIDLVDYQEGSVVSRRASTVPREPSRCSPSVRGKAWVSTQLRSMRSHISWRAKRKLLFLANLYEQP